MKGIETKSIQTSRGEVRVTRGKVVFTQTMSTTVPLIISIGGEIVVGDKVYDDHSQNISTIYNEDDCALAQARTFIHKIIALPENLSHELRGKVFDGEEVDVECEIREIDCPDGIEGCEAFHTGTFIRKDKHDHITLHKAKPASYTKEDMSNLLDKVVSLYVPDGNPELWLNRIQDLKKEFI